MNVLNPKTFSMSLQLVALLVIATSCSHIVTVVQSPNITDSYQTTIIPSQPSDQVDLPVNESEREQVSSHGQFSNLFCPDSLSAKYLTETYYRQFNKNSSNIRGRHNSKLLMRRAMYHAQRALLNPSSVAWAEMPHADHPMIDMWINYFQSPSGLRDFLKWLIRSKEYEPLIMPILRQSGVPRELFFLAMIESGFNDFAFSKAKATGTWQFMKATGKSFGLKANYWVDERRNPEKATWAAVQYLTSLYRSFNHWHLAFAAYNSGPGRIRNAIRKANTRDYWALAKSRHLNIETRQYVPKILAAFQLAENTHRFGFKIFDTPKRFEQMVSIPIAYPISIRDLSIASDIDYSLLRSWNPELVRDVTPPHVGESTVYHLQVPNYLASSLTKKISEAPRLEIRDVQMYTIKKGDTIVRLAKQFKISPTHIKSINPQLLPSRLRIGARIAIPVPQITGEKILSKG